MANHKTYIKRCIEIAKNGLGSTSPNPMVGSVVVYNNKIIGEGYTSPYGGNHAEVNAINSVANKSLLKEATIYVTLEPCSHFGKTPPCSDLIIHHKIPNIVIGCIDDNVKVAGKGIKKLIDANCNVTVGVLEAACKEHHKRFFTFHNKKRPYIILKWAETNDGFIAPKNRKEQKPVWITNKYSRQLVHKWRSEEQAILVGTNTVLQDNPSLTVREWKGKHPTRVVIDKSLKLPKKLSIFNNEAKTIVMSENLIDFNKNIPQQICAVLHENDITSVIVEGGRKMLQTFIDENLWDEARVFKGPIEFKEGVYAPKFSGKLISEEKIMSDTLKIYKNG
ncbi:bifunctional diaminohydroxyphosphoribosylaminopyrimidine deaminase/5-amino-6-(5-phosphoribosylamino)uracil reductase RibD [Flavivirga sp. 57AJ16]|uniref:bifunctional diaminohydroxyphosphoribosylaminopyrimidine deaminase/5-amino-6-(5-phosphoribosylamino)uracil reductase RibD n=1 Tax=Flavivirga sp. 57AJ16 TaxID=3025307 RepID=UPI002366F0A6|nr:bifunctional diaminohydroxyphosphoribosylaminopyrimidine deaminase/5-amino-6-(5-phosphoribosylamino)uracil reductase RibD [Flavivirga sp. 57AJ16]MDD7887427.1 bifunctional diaminohydroxyphosphoribosylaminopyrimidine deaminase/5-amino-6-(5-phosphoribosylamino)uracil reductase RibD [Flavivirga sp. 57AJ16]